ncbi:hypothetical protein PtB15_5B582 [Puccinia triticina]|nr:hypothetical protein PtB15_5B582 [Puccinia triticina]
MSDGQERRAESTPSPLEGDQFTNEAHTLSSIGQELFGFESPVSVSSDEVMTHSWYGDVSPSYSHGNNSDINKEEDEEKESVADDADPVVFNFGDARDQAALNKMENVVLGWLQRITFLQQSGLRESTGGRPGFDLGLPSVLFPTRRGQDCVGSTLKESKDIAKMFSIMSLSQGAILDQKILTYRTGMCFKVTRGSLKVEQRLPESSMIWPPSLSSPARNFTLSDQLNASFQSLVD